MRTMYKGDKVCKADFDQVPAMEAGGWSTTKPVAKKAAPKSPPKEATEKKTPVKKRKVS